jgi:Domain of unknown function (DUF4262)
MTAGRRNTATHQKMSEPPWIVAGTRDPKESIMCWACDHPGGTRADHLDHVRTVIARYGWAVQGVRRDGVHPPWAYTVGLTTFGQPGLAATGLSPRRAADLLNGVAEHLLHAAAVRPGGQVKLVDGPLIQIVEVAELTAHLTIAVDLFGPRIRALQVVPAGDCGHWPWEPGYRRAQDGQPELGKLVRAAVRLGGSAAPLPDDSDAPADGRRPAAERRAVRSRPSRASGRRRETRGPHQRSARSSSRLPSRRR